MKRTIATPPGQPSIHIELTPGEIRQLERDQAASAEKEAARLKAKQETESVQAVRDLALELSALALMEAEGKAVTKKRDALKAAAKGLIAGSVAPDDARKTLAAKAKDFEGDQVSELVKKIKGALR